MADVIGVRAFTLLRRGLADFLDLLDVLDLSGVTGSRWLDRYGFISYGEW